MRVSRRQANTLSEAFIRAERARGLESKNQQLRQRVVELTLDSDALRGMLVMEVTSVEIGMGSVRVFQADCHMDSVVPFGLETIMAFCLDLAWRVPSKFLG